MKRLLLVLVAALALVATSCGSTGTSGGSSAAAVVNGTTISMDQLNAELAMQADLQMQAASAQGQDPATIREGIYGATATSFSSSFTASVLSQMISTQLVEDEAAARGVTPSSEDEATAATAVTQQYEGVELDPATQEELVRRFSVASALNTALTEEFPTPTLTEDDVRAIYDQSIDSLVAQYGDFACVDLIAVGWTDTTSTQITPEVDAATLAAANDVRAQLVAGASFEELAPENSDEPKSQASGGDYGCLPQGNFQITEVDTAAFSQEVGEISEPLASDYGYLIVKVRSRGVPSFEEIEDDLRSQIEQQQASSSSPINNWYKATQSTLEVEVNPQVGSWGVPEGSTTGAHQVLPPEGASTQTTVAPEGGLGGELPIDLSQLSGSGG